jgi:hypothetical protein
MGGPVIAPGEIRADDVRARVVVDVGGVSVALRAADSVRAAAVASLFRHARPSTGPAEAEVEFRVEPVAVPVGPPATDAPDVRLWSPGPDHRVLRTRAGLTASVTPRTLVVGGDAPELGREFRFAALLGLTYLMARHDRHLLHGASIVLDAGALLIVGGTGTGKSTLAYAAHGAGLAVVADDAVLARRTVTGVVVRGVPRPVAVAADVGGALAGRPVPEDPRRRRELPPGSLDPGEHRVVALAVATGADPRGPGLDPITGPAALRAVLASSVSLADPEVRPALLALAGDLARLPRWWLRRGADPASAVHDSRAQLADLTRRLAAAP